VAAFQVIPYLPRKKIDFTREVLGLLDASEEDLKELIAEKEEIPLENTNAITNITAQLQNKEATGYKQ